MREGWKYCKLGDLCTIERGGSPRPISDYITNSEDGYNWIKIGDASEDSKYITSTKEKIKKEGLKKTRFVHKGDFILSNSMSFGKPYILDIDGCIHDGWLVIHDDKNVFIKEYLYYVLGSPNMYKEFQRLAVGGVVNNLNSELVRNVTIAVPPIEEQQRIVTELDLLSSIIEKQKAQLKELDTLAQSIFYDMFGDPVTNEKGWKTELMCIIAPSSEYRGEHTDIDGKYWLLNLDKVESMTGRVTEKEYFDYKDIGSSTISFDTTNVLYSKLRPYLNKVVLPNETGYATSELIPLKPNKELLDRCYFANMLRSNEFMTFIKDKVAGAKMPRVSMSDFKKFLVPLPPLSLQQQFADKIQSIESQKSAITKSIAETQKLFDYTMDKYFG